MSPDANNVMSLTTSRNILHSKWDTLFDIEAKEWIAFKPALGLHVYPCYSCRHLFFSKKSFQDHINRRAIVLTYKCSGCNNTSYTFYNRCIMLLHCRKHYTVSKGTINLNNLEVSLIDLNLLGFSRLANIPYFFDVQEEYVTGDVIPNSQFYAPKPEDKGKEIIVLTPCHLVINRTDSNGVNQSLALKQIAHNIPKCVFITLEMMKEHNTRAHFQFSEENLQYTNCQIEIKDEIDNHGEEEVVHDIDLPLEQESIRRSRNDREDSDSLSNNDFEHFALPVIAKIETVDEFPSSDECSDVTVTRCIECQKEIHDDIKDHFLGSNKPVNTDFRCNKCRLMCATECAFKAHLRIHIKKAPFVCPDCGIQFSKFDELFTHMEKICFHMVKSVRIKCPGKRCGKIFASENTFAPHFLQIHIVVLYQCCACKDLFRLLEDCQRHCQTMHKEGTKIVKFFNCPACNTEDMTLAEKDKHVDQHCKDPSRRLYVYKCKFCKYYFRSLTTLLAHIENCKFQKLAVTSKYISGQCIKCNSRMIIQRNQNNPLCNKCCKTTEKIIKKPMYRCSCVLCKQLIDFNDRRSHQKECKYGKPQVLVERLQIDMLDKSFNSSTSDVEESTDGSTKNRRDSSDDNRPKKRQKPIKPKKSDSVNDLTADEPIFFDGTYSCRVCSYKDSKRELFHDHVKTHRQISTAYQCMECGECFVVKPSLMKHLTHYHNISNCEKYFKENDCFDEGAVKELAKVVKAPYLANNVKENQCRVCMKEFESRELHDKHFRIHGMAFLLTKSVDL
ncbi:hypothetical protein GWI33_002230 [Rhynchophorus ferrugineus]|uniref:C2H2-type domain-containing protein n=1 Tax=Rhynchophorus ferrugineus TaxID=354439 RepID=A0A834IKJ4_RHYFE|nr:hypothetical protein GWI33_002230 [Rhynchophorus ferrugineus]